MPDVLTAEEVETLRARGTSDEIYFDDILDSHEALRARCERLEEQLEEVAEAARTTVECRNPTCRCFGVLSRALDALDAKGDL